MTSTFLLFSSKTSSISFFFCRIIEFFSTHKRVFFTFTEEVSTLHLAELVSKYKPLEIELVKKTRDFDRKEQSVNESIYTVPLHYTPVADGIERIFKGKENEKAQ